MSESLRPTDTGIPNSEEARALALDLLGTTQRECPGWNPPPFTPDLYARVLDIAVLRVDDSQPWDAMYIPNRARPRIILNTRNASPGRMNFSLAHEIAHSLLEPAPSGTHYFRARSDYYDGTPATLALERACDAIAAELLMPAPWFREAVSRRGMCASAVPVIAREFGVSMEAAAARMVEVADTPCAIAFIHHAGPFGYVTPAPPANRIWAISEEESGSCWRVRRAFHGRGFPRRFRENDPVPEDSVLVTTGLTGRPGSGTEWFRFPRAVESLQVSAVARGGYMERPPTLVVGVFTVG